MLPATVSLQLLLLVLRIAGVPVGLAMIAVFTFLERHADAITEAKREIGSRQEVYRRVDEEYLPCKAILCAYFAEWRLAPCQSRPARPIAVIQRTAPNRTKSRTSTLRFVLDL